MSAASASSLGGVISWFTRHRTAANLLMVLTVLLGLIAAPRMQAQFFPDVVIDSVTVSVVWDGASAEDVDRAIVQVLSPSLQAIEGVEESHATSRENYGYVKLEFEPGWDMGRASDDVEAAVDAIDDLPDDAETPKIARGVWRDRVTDVVITGPVAVDQLGQFADEFMTRLYNEGVTRTALRGIADPGLKIEVPSTALMAHDITLAEIATTIAAEAEADPAGDVTGGSTRVRVGVEKRSIEDVRAIVLRSSPNGETLSLGDIATITRETIDGNRNYYVGDDRAMVIRVDRSASGDALDIQAQVEDVAAQMQVNLPQGVEINLVRTRSEQISSRLNILIDNGLTGLALVLILLFLFLNARTAFWVAAGIPVAMLGALALMYAAGLTINMISLFAMIITIGIVVDDAIVVGEHADARVRKFGEAPVVAAERAARRMAMPVFCATLTTLLAFYGLTLIGGGFGNLILDLPFTVIVVLMASLLECFLILPHHMSHALAHAQAEHWYDWPSRTVNRGFVWVREKWFRPLMRLVIVARYPVLAAAIALLAMQSALLITKDVPWRFFNAPESGSVTGNFVMTANAERADTLAMMQELQRTADALGAEYEARYGENPLDHVLAEIGGNAGFSLSSGENRDPDQLGAISIELIDPDLRPYSSFDFADELRDRVNRHPLVEDVSFRGWRSGPGEDALSIEFYGASVATLKTASEVLQEALQRLPEVSGVQDNLTFDKDELILDLTPQGQALGFGIDGLGQVLRNRLNGIEAASFAAGPRTAEIRVSLPEQELTADFLERMQVRAPSGTYVPLADIVQVQERTGFSTIRRENGVRVVSVTGDLDESNPERAADVTRLLKTEILPEISENLQVEWRLTGLAEQEEEFLRDAMFGLSLALTGIYLVLALVFSSWSRPLVVMAVIPFGMIGTIWGHAVWDVPFSIFTVVGLLGMTGIIINDSIVLVTTIDEHAQKRGIFPAIVEGAVDRLRPVLLTTLTTVLGLAPLLFEQSTQAQFLKPTVITLVYGLGFGMVLVLLVVPAVLATQQDLARQTKALRRALTSRDADIRLWARLAMATMLGWMTLTLGHTAIYGRLPEIFDFWDNIATQNPMGGAFGLFAAGSVLFVVLGYFAVFLTRILRGYPAEQP